MFHVNQMFSRQITKVALKHRVKIVCRMSIQYEVSGKVAMVTGGALGLGAAISEELLKGNVKAIVIFDVSEENGKETVDRLNSTYGEGKAQFIKCDVSNTNQLSAAYKQVIDCHRRIDIVVNNAGIFQETRDTFKKMIDINFSGVVDGTLQAVELMQANSGGAGGVIINIASTSALMATHMFPIYGATKAAILYFSNAIGTEPIFTRTQVRVLVILLGATSTTMMDNLAPKCTDTNLGFQIENLIKSIPKQSTSEAARACIDVLRRGKSGSSWCVDDGAATDVSERVRAGRTTTVVVAEKNVS